MPTDQNESEYFPELNEVHLRSFAQQAVERFWNVQIMEVSLYHCANIYFGYTGKELPLKYVMVFRRPGKAMGEPEDELSLHQDFYQTDFSAAELEEIFGDPLRRALELAELSTLRDTSAFHELTGGIPFSILYSNGIAPEKYFLEWRFIDLHDGQSLPQSVLLDYPHWVLFEKEELFLTNLLGKVRLEIEPLYQAVKNVGFSAHKLEANEETWRKAALECFDSHKASFHLVKREYLESKELYSFADGQARRDFVGRVLQHVVEENGLGHGRKEDLIKEYNRITSD